MLVSARSPLTVAAAAILAAGVVAVAPVEISAGTVAPRVITAVKLVAAPGGFEGGWATEVVPPLADLFDPAHSYTYVPNGSGPSVSHPVGLIPQLLQDAQNPPILQAIKSTGGLTLSDVYFQTSISSKTPQAIVRQQVGVAISHTFTPSHWGGGKVLNDWADAARVRKAMTFGVGAKVDGKWVPSIRVAAISARNQIANDILGTQKYPNLARDYSPDWERGVVETGSSGSPLVVAPKPAASGRAHWAARPPTATHTAAVSAVKPAASRR